MFYSIHAVNLEFSYTRVPPLHKINPFTQLCSKGSASGEVKSGESGHDDNTKITVACRLHVI